MTEIEDKAKAMGWKTQDEFKGDPEKFKSAEDFLKVADNYGVLKESVDRLTDKIVTLESQRKRDLETFNKFQEFASKSEKRAFDQAEENYKTKLSNLKAGLKKAAKEEDWDTFNDLEKDLDGLEKPIPPQKIETPPASSGDPTQTPEWQAFLTENSSWYNKDPEMTMYAINTAGPFVKMTNSNLVGKAFYDEVTKQVKDKFPEKFTNPKQTQPPPVEGGGSPPAKTNSKDKTWANLPDDAKAEYNEFKAIMPNYTKEQFLKSYIQVGGEFK